MQLRLFDWGPSPFCLKVRSLLEYKGAEHIASDLRRELSALCDMLADGRPFLPGPSPWLYDFAVNAQLVYLSRPPGSAQLLQEFAPIAEYIGRMKALRSR